MEALSNRTWNDPNLYLTTDSYSLLVQFFFCVLTGTFSKMYWKERIHLEEE